MTKVTPQEVDTTMALSRVLLTTVSGSPPHIALGSLIMAAALAGRAIGVPLESFNSVVDTTLEEVYSVDTKKALN